MATNNMNNLTTLIKRLEAATARLEDIASSTIELPQAVPALQQSLASPATGPSQASTPVPKQPTYPLAIKPKEEPLPESIEEFDAFLKGPLEKYAELSKSIGGLVGDQAAEVVKGFKEQRKFLLLTTKAKKPDLSGPEIRVYQDLVKPINETIMAVTKIKDDNRGSPFFSQLSAVSEGIMVLAWVNIENRPYKHVDESLGSAQFFGNRVLKEQKDKDPQQIEWVRAFYGIFRELSDYVKQHFNNGIPWNQKGLPAAEAVKSLNSTGSSAPPPPASAPGGGAPPPPPPPGPPPVLQIKEQGAPAPSNSTGLGAVFSELNQGEAVTKGLKKVDKSQMTHKNPALRASSTVPGSGSESSGRGKSPVPGKKPKPESMRVKKPPKKELDGNKWTIENYDNESEPVEIEAHLSHSILISKCAKTTIIIRGKANAVTVENTTRLSLIVESLVSSVDAVKSANFALQIMGTVPTVLLDQIDNAQIYFSKDSMATRVFHSKSDGINLNVLHAGEEDEEYKELALPSQMCSYFDAKKGELVNEIVAHAG